MNADKLPIQISPSGAISVMCPMTGKRESEKRCRHCEKLRMIEFDHIKCNYYNIENEKERIHVQGI